MQTLRRAFSGRLQLHGILTGAFAGCAQALRRAGSGLVEAVDLVAHAVAGFGDAPGDTVDGGDELFGVLTQLAAGSRDLIVGSLGGLGQQGIGLGHGFLHLRGHRQRVAPGLAKAFDTFPDAGIGLADLVQRTARGFIQDVGALLQFVAGAHGAVGDLLQRAGHVGAFAA